MLGLAADGFSNPEIVQRLSLGVRTVESYRANFMRKLNLRNQTDLVRYALQRGLRPLARTPTICSVCRCVDGSMRRLERSTGSSA